MASTNNHKGNLHSWARTLFVVLNLTVILWFGDVTIPPLQLKGTIEINIGSPAVVAPLNSPVTTVSEHDDPSTLNQLAVRDCEKLLRPEISSDDESSTKELRVNDDQKSASPVTSPGSGDG